MTYRELVFMILDQLKLSSDDSYFDTPHIVWLINKYRALLIKRNYSDVRKNIPESMYQTICLELDLKDDCVIGTIVKSIQPVPPLLDLNDGGLLRITPFNDYFQAKEFTYISKERMPYTGYNKYLKNIIYFSIWNNYLYVKSTNSGYEYLKTVSLTGLFEDPSITTKPEYSCNGTKCVDILDMLVPIEEALVPSLMEMVIQDLNPDIYRPEDNINNAKDDLSGAGQKQ